MPLDRETLDQLRHLLRPLAARVANLEARGVVQLVDDSTEMQLLQLGVLDGETIDDAEHYQPYGLTSVPLPGAEAVVVFPNGDRSHPLVVTVADRRHRPTGGDPGDVTLHQHTGAKVILKASGDIEVQPAPGPEGVPRARARDGRHGAGETADRGDASC
jgi:phage baseplate assembly protein V